MRMMRDYRSFSRLLKQAVAGAAPVVVHVNTSVQYASLLRDLVFVAIGRLLRAQLVVAQLHGCELNARSDRRPLLRLLARMLAMAADRLVVLSQSQAAAIGGAALDALVIPNAVVVREPVRHPPPLRDGRPLRLLFLARMIPQKGVLLCLDAMHLLRRRGVHAVLTLAGDGPLLRGTASSGEGARPGGYRRGGRPGAARAGEAAARGARPVVGAFHLCGGATVRADRGAGSGPAGDRLRPQRSHEGVRRWIRRRGDAGGADCRRARCGTRSRWRRPPDRSSGCRRPRGGWRRPATRSRPACRSGAAHGRRRRQCVRRRAGLRASARRPSSHRAQTTMMKTTVASPEPRRIRQRRRSSRRSHGGYGDGYPGAASSDPAWARPPSRCRSWSPPGGWCAARS